MNTIKFDDGNFYLNGEYIGSGKLTSATETIRQKDARIKFLEEQLIHERARSEKFLHTLNEYEKICKTPEELQRLAANAWNKAIELGSIQAKYQILKEEAITIDMVEKAAYDVIQGIIRENDDHRSSLYAARSDEALVTLATSRLVERVKQYAKKY